MLLYHKCVSHCNLVLMTVVGNARNSFSLWYSVVGPSAHKPGSNTISLLFHATDAGASALHRFDALRTINTATWPPFHPRTPLSTNAYLLMIDSTDIASSRAGSIGQVPYYQLVFLVSIICTSCELTHFSFVYSPSRAIR